ncbi:hypothetical protein P9112_011135 [Eukaryota sp. TZLM1-RC]
MDIPHLFRGAVLSTSYPTISRIWLSQLLERFRSNATILATTIDASLCSNCSTFRGNHSFSTTRVLSKRRQNRRRPRPSRLRSTFRQSKFLPSATIPVKHKPKYLNKVSSKCTCCRYTTSYKGVLPSFLTSLSVPEQTPSIDREQKTQDPSPFEQLTVKREFTATKPPSGGRFFSNATESSKSKTKKKGKKQSLKQKTTNNIKINSSNLYNFFK